MKDQTRINQELIEEISALKHRIQELERSESECKRAEEALRASNELFSLYMRHSPIFTYIKEVTPIQSIVLQASDNFLQMIGIPGCEMVGKTMAELFPPEFAAQITADDWTVVSRGDVLRLDEEWNGRSYTTIKFPIAQGGKALLAGYTIDITDRKLVEEALRESEANFRRFLDDSPLGMRIVTAEGETIYANKAILDFYGYDSIEELETTPVEKRYTPESYAEFQIRREKRKRGDYDSSEYEISIIRTDGEIRRQHVYRKEILWNGERQYQVMYQDITERKREEDDLSLRAVRIQALLDLHRMETESQQTILDCTLEAAQKACRSQCSFIGLMDETESCMTIQAWSKDTMAQCAVVDKPIHFPISEAGVWGDCIRQRRPVTINDYEAPWPSRKGYPEGHVPIRRFLSVPIFDDNKIVAVAAVANKKEPYTEGDVHALIALLNKMWEILWRRQVEEALRESEKTARRLSKENELIAEIGRIISSTPNIEEVYERFAEKVRESIPFDQIVVSTVNMQDDTRTERYSSGDLIPSKYLGKVFSLAGTRTEHVVRTRSSLVINSKNTEDMLKKFPGMLLKFNSQSMMIVPLLSKDVVIGVLSVQSAIIDAYCEDDLLLTERVGSQIAGAIANAQLVLERTQAEEERKKLQERLQRSEKMESLGTLAGGVAHDLNNVLGIVVGYAEMILDGVDKSSPIRHGLENIMNGGLKAAAIVDDLLTLARRGVPGRSILNLNKIVADCQQSPEFANLSSHHPSVKIKTDLETDLLNISGSSVHLGKTLYNLISNASEAMPKGGSVTIKTTNQYLDKPIEGYDEIREGDYVVLSVSDTGEGISENDLKRIFEPFYTKKIMGRSGTGLGLAVVWGTVKDHNGYINVQSEEGKGSTFALYFPVTRGDITAEGVAVPTSEYMGNGESILVVDDVKEQRDLAAGMLSTLNYNVSSVASGEEAVAYLKEHEIDLMVLDMIMAPGMDGLDTYKSILNIRPKQKSIIVSGFSESDRVKTAKCLGAGAYVRKPYIKEKLGLAARKELNRSA